MIKALHLLRLLLFVICLFDGTVSAQTFWSRWDSVRFPDIEGPLLPPYTSDRGMREPLGQPTGSTFLLNLGPKVIELKTSHLERRVETSALANASSYSNRGGYFDVLATSSLFGRLVGEGELAYSTLGLTPAAKEPPKQLRTGLKGQWGDMSYGADYRSTGSGFVFLTGARIDRPRDESQFWGEYDLGSLRIRGSFSELWEKMSDTKQLSFMKTAATSLNFNQPDWSGMLYSSYSVIEQPTALNQKSLAVTNGLSGSYRPVTILSVEPNLSLKEEWDPKTGLRTETPSAALLLNYAPFRSMQLTGRTSYARGRSQDGLKDLATVSTAAALNWQLEKSLVGEKLLSFQVEYNNQLDFNYQSHPQETLGGKLQLKVVGF